MRKYASLDDRSLAPTLIFALPELVYPQRLNAARTCLEAARVRGGSAAYLHGDCRLPLPEVEGEVGRYAAALRRLGVAAGDRVLLRLADTPTLVCAILAVQAIGAIAVPTYVQLRADDLLYRVRDAGARVALVGANLLTEMRPCAADAGDALRVAAAPEDPEGRSRRCCRRVRFGPTTPTATPTTSRSSSTPPAAPETRKARCIRIATSSRSATPMRATACSRRRTT
jgi:acyl-coenzyme A synthetase/AMP-(fatty) acid ligase